MNLGFFELSVLCFTFQWYKLLESHLMVWDLRILILLFVS